MMKDILEKLALEQQIVLEKPRKACKEKFYKIARSRVRFVSEEESKQIFYKTSDDDLKRAVGDNFVPCPLLYMTVITEKGDRKLESLDIVINKEFFQRADNDFTDILPYAIEHEIYEAWLCFVYGGEFDKAHYLARRKEVKFAVKDQKIDRLHLFYLLIHPSFALEVEKEYNKFKKQTR